MNILAGLARAGGILSALNGLLPVIGQAVADVEALFPNAGAGAQKLAWVENFIKGVLTKGGNALADVESLAPMIVSLINSVVAAAKTPAVPVIAPVAPAP